MSIIWTRAMDEIREPKSWAPSETDGEPWPKARTDMPPGRAYELGWKAATAGAVRVPPAFMSQPEAEAWREGYDASKTRVTQADARNGP